MAQIVLDEQLDWTKIAPWCVHRSLRAGVTRVELVVVLGVGVLLVCLLAVLLVRQRENGLRLQCMNNLRRIGDGVQSFHTVSQPAAPFLPPARIAPDYATWAVLIAPHLAPDSALQHWDVAKPYF